MNPYVVQKSRDNPRDYEAIQFDGEAVAALVIFSGDDAPIDAIRYAATRNGVRPCEVTILPDHAPADETPGWYDELLRGLPGYLREDDDDEEEDEEETDFDDAILEFEDDTEE